MTHYNLTPPTLPSVAARETKQARKHLLEQVRKRRYKQEQARQERQQKVYSNSSEYREYQEMLKEEAKLY